LKLQDNLHKIISILSVLSYLVTLCNFINTFQNLFHRNNLCKRDIVLENIISCISKIL